MERGLLQAWWAHRQGLAQVDANLRPSQILKRVGWARSVGGVNPYLTLFSRGRLSREEIDHAVAHLDIHELPCARGCTYVVPHSEFALALAVGRGFGEEAAISTAKKFLGVTDAEIEGLMSKVLDALKQGAMDPRMLKDAVGEAVRNLGDEGKKRGLTTTLPLALGRLQTAGAIRRIPINGRLDQQRYRYTLWNTSRLPEFRLSQEEAFVELAKRYFRWIGPASIAHFQWFSGLGVKASKEALAPLGLVPIEGGSDLLIFPDDKDDLLSFQIPSEPQYSLLAGIDGLFLHRREVRSLLSPEDEAKEMAGERGPLTIGGVLDLSNHAIVDRGRLVGLWEYDPTTSSVAWSSFIPKNADLEKAVTDTEAFVRDQLGDARSFSLDSPESRAPRIQAIRAMS